MFLVRILQLEMKTISVFSSIVLQKKKVGNNTVVGAGSVISRS